MAEVGKAFVSIVPTMKGAQKTIQSELDGQMGPAGDKAGQKFGGAFSKSASKVVAGFAGLAVVSKTVSLFKEATAASSDYNETISKAGEIFGKSSLPALKQFAAGASKTIGQSRQQALDAAATFAIFGKSAGLSGKDLVGFSTKFTNLASDLASFHNSSPQEAIDAIGAALRGEAEPMRRFGVLLDDATLRAEALKLGIVKTTKDALTPQQKVLAAQAVIFKQTKDAQGDFARTSDGLANSQRTLAASIEDAKIKLGDSFRPVVERVIPVVQSLIDKVASSPTALRILAVLVGVVLVGAFVALAVSVIAATWPFILITAAIALLAAGFIYAYTHSETFRKIVNFLAAAVLDLAARFLGLAADVGDAISFILGSLGKVKGFGWAADAAKQVKDYAKQMRTAADKTGEFADKVRNIPTDTKPKIKTPNLKSPLADVTNLGKGIKNIPASKDAKVTVNSLKTPIEETKTLKTNIDGLRSKTINIQTNYTTTGKPVRRAAGSIVSGATRIIAGETGREAIVPLDRPLNMVDPSVRWLAAYAQGKTDLSGTGATSLAAVGSGGGSDSGGRMAFVITNWAEGTGYFTELADAQVAVADAFAGTTRRMGR